MPSSDGPPDCARSHEGRDDAARGVADVDQTTSDADRASADTDQAASERDRGSAARDQALSDADQRASDDDQSTADGEAEDAAEAGDPQSARSRGERTAARERREDTTAARAATSGIRARTALGRLDVADARDEVSRARDLAAAARDLAADARDGIAPDDGETSSGRGRAAEDRRRAADDRRRAAEDRGLSRVDRDALRAALVAAYIDDLTGAYRREIGALALQAELDRAVRAGRGLVLAFVDVDNLKQHNERGGHAAGDALLVAVVASIRSELRSYDPVVRFGGDEFVCALAEADIEAATARFAEIRERLERVHPGASISVGFASLEPGDTLEGLIARGDSALLLAKRHRAAVPPARGGEADGHRRRHGDSRPAMTIERVLAERMLHAVYQPIVDLQTGATVAVEALARGPAGVLASPQALFAEARRCGRLVDLERLCQDAAVAGARRAHLGLTLFLNVEAEAMSPDDRGVLDRTVGSLDGSTSLVVEITERSLTSRPAELIDFLQHARRLGCGIALDDVGIDPRSLALLPIVRPDLVKLDRTLIQSRLGPASAATITAVAAACERTGAIIVAEGIETERHRRVALAAGATLGQGYLLGRPGSLAPRLTGSWQLPRISARASAPTGATPFTILAAHRALRRTNRRFMLEVSKVLEEQARSLGPEALVVSAFQEVRRLAAATADRYRLLGARAGFVAALGAGMPAEPVPGVRGATLDAGDPLRDEWCVLVLGPHFSGAIAAKQRGAAGSAHEFEYATTYDRDLVVSAATNLMLHVSRTS